MDKKEAQPKAESVPTGKNYTVWATCSVCGARTLECITVPQQPKLGNKIPNKCKTKVGVGETCSGTLSVRSIFAEE